ncbi:MAG: hypothetical protein QT12_C0006G0021 [archaeon GW2011_AR21]|uniref:Uncharacterized protein n=1 Tax=Candidatus Iainarchaeum sp. TaxID=3101447 RepID=A0A7J4KUI6_9ARCH|nr:MAG: hypothetical protein QT12_C0006G0021 [archaeon GW2011_AR21]HIH33592.1 hypothetical protein [Candidatus Diapherotrites archaeon]
MPSSQEKLFWLSRVSYAEEKREIVAEFSNLEEKRIKRFAFFPKAFFALRAGETRLVQEILSLYDGKRFQTRAHEGKVLEIHASTFSDLKKISSLLQQSLKQGLIIVEPERQFLLEKEWNYFDSFNQEGFGLEKACEHSMPGLRLEECAESLEKTISLLAVQDAKTLEKFIQQFAFAKALAIPAGFAPESIQEAAGIFIENAFFKNSFAIAKENSQSLEAFGESASGFFTNVSEIDFTMVWAGLLSNPSLNLGFETLNCNCCKPSSLQAENILPDSKALVKFLQNGFYFQSQNPAFAAEFHNSHERKQARLERMREWFLPSLPTGPFRNGEKALIPLPDALMLEREEKAEVMNEIHGLKWHCLARESFIAREIQALILRITQTEDKMLELEHNALKAQKVLCSIQLSESPEYTAGFFEKKCLEGLLKEVLKELNNPRSSFYSANLASALGALQCLKLAEFKQLAKIQGEKVLQASAEVVLVQAQNPSSLMKEFSQKAKTIIPTISKNFRQVVIG